MRRWHPVLIALVALTAHLPVLSAGFVWDDHFQVLGNPWIRDPALLGQAFVHDLAGFLPGFETSYYRPLAHVLHAAVYSCFGTTPWPYHLVNLLLHVAASLCVFVLARRATGVPVAALLSALLFAVHPVHVEPVAWVTGVIDVAYSLLALLALIALTSENGKAWLAVPALFGLALLWKEPAAALLPIVAAFLLAKEGRAAFRGRSAALLVSMVVVFAAYLALRWNALGGMAARTRNAIEVGPVDGVLTAVALMGQYARYIILPVDLAAVHDLAVVSRSTDPHFLVGTLVVAIAAVAAWRFRRAPWELLGLSVLVLPILPALYVPALRDSLFAERYLYLPSAGAALLLAFALARLSVSRFKRASWVAAVLVVAVFAAASFQRARAWESDLTLWSDAVQKAPRSAVAHESLGAALVLAGRQAEAVPVLSRSLELDPERVDARVNLAFALTATGRADEALGHAERAVRTRPAHVDAWVALAWALDALGRVDEAATAYDRALSRAPARADIQNLAGANLARAGRLDLALVHFQEAVRLAPGTPDYERNLAQARRLR